MSHVAISKVSETQKKTLPIFDEIAKRFEAVRRRAFDLFEKRGCEFGHDLDDWFRAEREIFGWPAAEMAEKDGAYDLQVTLPGFDAKDVEVTAAPNEVVVHAAVEATKKGEKAGVLWTEFGSNEVYRRFSLPKAIEVDKLTASLEKGILRIKAPEVAQPAAQQAKKAAA